MSVSESELSSAPEPIKKKHSIGIFEWVTIGVLSVLAFLFGANVFVVTAARNYNDACCYQAIIHASDAAIKGKAPDAVQHEALEGLSSCEPIPFLLDRPQFDEFKDQEANGIRQLRIVTRSTTRIPYPQLILNDHLRESGQLPITTMYVVQIKE